MLSMRMNTITSMPSGVLDDLAQLAALYLIPWKDEGEDISNEEKDRKGKYSRMNAKHLADIKALSAVIAGKQLACRKGVSALPAGDTGIVAALKPSGCVCDDVKASMASLGYPKWCNIHRVDKAVSGILVGSEHRAVRSKLQKDDSRERGQEGIHCAHSASSP